MSNITAASLLTAVSACDNYDEVCGEDGPLRSYQGARDIPLRPLAARLVLTLTPDTLHTPSFEGLDGLVLKETSSKRRIWWASIADKKTPPVRILESLQNHASVAEVYPVYTLPSGQEAGITDELVVALDDPRQVETIEASLTLAKIELIRPVRGLDGVYLARSESGDAIRQSARLQSLSGLRYAPNPIFFVFTSYVAHPMTQISRINGTSTTAPNTLGRSRGQTFEP